MPWFKNLTKKDLLLSDLRITIKAGHTVDPFLANPKLTQEELRESESIGSIRKCLDSQKISQLAILPTKINSETDIKEATQPIPSRSRTAIKIDSSKKQYIEELFGSLHEETIIDRFANYADGIAEPDIIQERILRDDDPSYTASVPQEPLSRYIDIKNVKPSRY